MPLGPPWGPTGVLGPTGATGPTGPIGLTNDFASLVREERVRQETKFPDQHLPDNTCLPGDDNVESVSKSLVGVLARRGTLGWREVLMEEVAEAFNAEGNALIAELVQVAAVCERWAVDIHRRTH